MVEIYRGEKIFTSQAWQQIGWSGLLRHTGGYFFSPQAWQQTSWGGLVRYTGERNFFIPQAWQQAVRVVCWDVQVGENFRPPGLAADQLYIIQMGENFGPPGLAAD